jgi:hypothetical protein
MELVQMTLLSTEEEYAAKPSADQLRYARSVIDLFNAFCHGLTEHDKEVFIAGVIAKARRDGRIAERMEWK